MPQPHGTENAVLGLGGPITNVPDPNARTGDNTFENIEVVEGGTLPALSVGNAELAANAVTTDKLAAGAVRFADALVFVSAERTATGAEETIAHGLAVVPAKVLVIPTDLNVATIGAFTVTEGTHTATNVLVTVTLSKKYKVLAWS